MSLSALASSSRIGFLISRSSTSRGLIPPRVEYKQLDKLHGILVGVPFIGREVKRFVDLTADEISDLWITAQKIGSRPEIYQKAASLTLTIHVDEKEKELKQKFDLDKERKDRSLEELAQEAEEYR